MSTIYVDELQGPEDHPWCHLNIAPGASLDDLHAFAGRLGLKREWFTPHVRPELSTYRLSEGKRVQALRLGAVYKAGMDQAREARAAWKARGELKPTAATP